MKPEGIGRREIVMRWEGVRGIIRGKGGVRRRIQELYERNRDIMGVYCREKGVRRMKTQMKGKGVGRIREGSRDTRVERREIRLMTRSGLRTRRMWMSEEPLPLGERDESIERSNK